MTCFVNASYLPEIDAMKYFLLALILLMSSVRSRAQYASIFNADTTGYKIKVEVYDSAIDNKVSVYGDTIINDVAYKYVDSGANEPEVGPYTIGFIREDTTTGQIWFRRIADTQERLVMDLSLEVGETFPIYEENLSCSDAGAAEVKRVEFIGNRKRVTLDCRYGGGIIRDTIQFIEGVGPNATFFYQTLNLNIDPINPEGIYSGFAYTLCRMYKSDTLFYPENEGALCNVNIATEDVRKGTVSIFPNPTDGTIALKSERPIRSVSIHAINGQAIPNIVLSNEIDVSNLSSGLYVLKVILASGDIVVKKLIKR